MRGTRIGMLAVLAGAPALGTDDLDLGCVHEALAARAWLDRSGHFDPETGRDTRNYPPHRVADLGHMRLEIEIPDMDVARFDAVQTLTFSPIARPLAELPLDAHLLDVQAVTCEGRQTSFDHDGGTLVVRFDPPVPAGESVDLVTRYEVHDPPRGLTWTPSSEAWPGRPAQLHTQGQPETNSYWFPTHDFPHERLTTELFVTVPPGFVASSNGRLVRRSVRIEETTDTPAGDHDLTGHETFHWVQDVPHPSYLVSLVVGKFDTVDVGTRDLPMPVYVPPGRGDDVEGTYGRTAEMVELYEELFDEPYPWDRYAQVVVWNFAAGGMENTAATTMFDTAILEEEALIDHSLEGLIAHELGHQWFGDLLTCRSWEHIWLNEGFASYLEALWWEHVEGDDGYQDDVLSSFDGVLRRDRAEAPDVPGMVSKEYVEPWDVFGRAANPYPKGASVLHMLRQKLGDEAFFRAIGEYVDRHRVGSVETADLRKALEDVSGEALERFFEQWCERPGVPRLDVGVEWDESSSRMTVTVTQTQRIDAYNPAFAFELPVWIMHAGAPTGGRVARIDVDGRETTAAFDLPSEPSIVAVDPMLAVLAEIRVDQPWHRWRSQLDFGPTLAARVQAARHLAEHTDETTRSRLAGVAADTSAHDRIREEAIAALETQGAGAELLAMLRTGEADHEVRLAVVEALAGALDAGHGEDVRQAAVETIAGHARRDPSQRVRAAGVRAIGTLRPAGQRSVILLAAETDSQHDRLREAALDALVELDTSGGLDIAIRLAQPGHLNRTRARAVAAIGSLAHHDVDRAVGALETLLADRERRTWEGAARALVGVGDERGLAALEALAQRLRDPADVRRAKAWHDELAEALSGG